MKMFILRNFFFELSNFSKLSQLPRGSGLAAGRRECGVIGSDPIAPVCLNGSQFFVVFFEPCVNTDYRFP